MMNSKYLASPLPCAAGDLRGFPARQLRVEHRRRDADTLLAAGLFAFVESRTVEELPEDLRELFGGDAGPVVLDDESVVVADLLDLDVDIGEVTGLLGGVERVVDRLLHGGDESSGPAVEPEHVLVLLEELGDGDRTLALRELRGDPPVVERRLEGWHWWCYPGDG